MAATGDSADQMEVEIDDTLYSRQRYVLGDSAMKKMAQSDVFISGMNGLGIEIAKNVVLAGVKSVTIHDTNTVNWSDLAAQFFLRESDINEKKNRAEASLPRLKELNSNVDVHSSTQLIDDSTDLTFLQKYRCVIFVDGIPLSTLTKINNFCRSQNPVINFITGTVRGVLSFGFCDFGDNFTVFDKNGEEPLEFFVSKITKSNPAVVSCLENERHGLEDGDVVEFKEVVGMERINGGQFEVKVINPSNFSISVDTSNDDYGIYNHGGRVRQLKQNHMTTFRSLSDELCAPTIQISDFCKMDNLNQYVLFIQALDQFQSKNGTLPRIHNEEDCKEVCRLTEEINSTAKLVDSIDNVLASKLTSCSAGLLPPLATTIGGVLAQECLISLTGKFSPLKQWLFLDALEVLEGLSGDDISTELSDRYVSVRACLGDTLLKKLGQLRLFMIGCGAIGCEMLKGYAQLGIGRGNEGGSIVITDNDIIEKSNLNRQFLFRDQHIQKHKSEVAANATLDINPDLSIDAQCFKVFPGTEETIYNDSFFDSLNLVVNALDNIEARRYVDSRCVTNMKPLLESGTLGTKGHVQVILPEKTESYSSQRDPPEKDVPYCTLKSFPATIEHTIQWARDKFESLWTQRPRMYEKFWRTHGSPSDLLKVIKGEELIPDGSVKCIKLLCSRPSTWQDCVSTGRIKFERYFNHKAKNLLQAFPLDTKMPDGSLFWQSPKRPPKILEFSLKDPLHMLFVKTFAKLYAEIHKIPYTEEDLRDHRLSIIIETTKIPQFVPSAKRIETDENAKRPEVVEMSEDQVEKTRRMLSEYVGRNKTTSKPGVLSLNALQFEKDDDRNGHIDFITASSNLRAQMYNIEEADRFKTKRIAGRIVPAIATTTAAVSGLVCLELIKVVMDLPLEKFKNAFMNLALPELPLLLTEPAAAQRSIVTANISYTLWTQWKIKGNDQMTLKQFLDYVKTEYNVEPTMVVLGVKMIYVPIMPGHRKRLPQTMKSLLKQGPDKKYVDLTLSFENEQGEDVPGPPVRYCF